jgi:hypothetical protein
MRMDAPPILRTTRRTALNEQPRRSRLLPAALSQSLHKKEGVFPVIIAVRVGMTV